jgi:hypothetical protein
MKYVFSFLFNLERALIELNGVQALERFQEVTNRYTQEKEAVSTSFLL